MVFVSDSDSDERSESPLYVVFPVHAFFLLSSYSSLLAHSHLVLVPERDVDPVELAVGHHAGPISPDDPPALRHALAKLDVGVSDEKATVKLEGSELTFLPIFVMGSTPRTLSTTSSAILRRAKRVTKGVC